MPVLYTVKQSAELLGTSTATVRRIADEFSEHLPDYQPLKGQARKLSDADLRTVYAIQSRLIDNPALTRAQVLRELSAPGSEPLIIPATLPTDRPASPQESPERPIADRAIVEGVESPQNALAPFLQAQELTQRQIAELSARIAEIRQAEPTPAPESARTLTPLIAAVLIAVGVLIVSLTVSALTQWIVPGVAGSALALFVLIVGLVAPSLRR